MQNLLVVLNTYGAETKVYIDGHASWAAPAVLSIFTIVNSLRILAYVPQIVRAARDNEGAAAISIMTWSLFLLSHLATIAYAIAFVGDLVMAIIFLGNAAACLVILAVTLLKRRHHGARTRLRQLEADPLSPQLTMDQQTWEVGLADVPPPSAEFLRSVPQSTAPRGDEKRV